jgi:hypothetical protein
LRTKSNLLVRVKSSQVYLYHGFTGLNNEKNRSDHSSRGYIEPKWNFRQKKTPQNFSLFLGRLIIKIKTAE